MDNANPTVYAVKKPEVSRSVLDVLTDLDDDLDVAQTPQVCLRRGVVAVCATLPAMLFVPNAGHSSRCDRCS